MRLEIRSGVDSEIAATGFVLKVAVVAVVGRINVSGVLGMSLEVAVDQ